jgi:hypothetical protein
VNVLNIYADDANDVDDVDDVDNVDDVDDVSDVGDADLAKTLLPTHVSHPFATSQRVIKLSSSALRGDPLHVSVANPSKKAGTCKILDRRTCVLPNIYKVPPLI